MGYNGEKEVAMTPLEQVELAIRRLISMENVNLMSPQELLEGLAKQLEYMSEESSGPTKPELEAYRS